MSIIITTILIKKGIIINNSFLPKSILNRSQALLFYLRKQQTDKIWGGQGTYIEKSDEGRIHNKKGVEYTIRINSEGYNWSFIKCQFIYFIKY